MGGDKGTNEGSNQEAENETDRGYKEYIDLLYDEGIQVGLLFKDMYNMDLYELQDTIEYRRKGLAYSIWRLASFTRSPFVKEFPESPEEACPELYPRKNTIKMPDFLMKKYIERSVKR